MILITGGAGFIGSNFIKVLLNSKLYRVICIDSLTYAGNRANLNQFRNDKKLEFVKTDINNQRRVLDLLKKYKPRLIINFAAETHVDKSIGNPKVFFETNVMGTLSLLEATKEYWYSIKSRKDNFRFIHISTDEVYGSLRPSSKSFTEESKFFPNSPYAASKASSDHIVRSFYKTYGLPSIISNCSNNYGPYQYPEKLIPLSIFSLLTEKKIPIYGKGNQIRDWIHVSDHCNAIMRLMDKGLPGQTYNICSSNQFTNLEVMKHVFNAFKKTKYLTSLSSFEESLEYVKDRLGHDFRYSLSNKKILTLGWKPEITFSKGIKDTVNWYLENVDWVKKVTDKSFQNWLNLNYIKRK